MNSEHSEIDFFLLVMVGLHYGRKEIPLVNDNSVSAYSTTVHSHW